MHSDLRPGCGRNEPKAQAPRERADAVQTKLLADIRTTVSMTGDDDAKEAAVKTLKKEMNDWTAKYRNSNEGGRPSFSNMYSAVNALAGHWTSFGSDAPVPKKRMARITKVRSAPSLPVSPSPRVL